MKVYRKDGLKPEARSLEPKPPAPGFWPLASAYFPGLTFVLLAARLSSGVSWTSTTRQ